MRALICVLALITTFSCSKESSHDASVEPGVIQGERESKEFISAMKEDISPELVISEEDLGNWVDEGLISEEEAAGLKN